MSAEIVSIVCSCGAAYSAQIDPAKRERFLSAWRTWHSGPGHSELAVQATPLLEVQFNASVKPQPAEFF